MTDNLTALTAILQFLNDNSELVILVLLLALKVLATWGRGNQKALLAVMKAFEDADRRGYGAITKADVSVAVEEAEPVVKAAIDHGVKVVDDKKTPAPVWVRLLRELVRIK